MPEQTLEEAVASILPTLPPAIRSFLTGPERDKVLGELSHKHGLRVDQSNVFEQQLIYLLLGVIAPPDLVEALRTANIPEETLESLVQDINEQILKPIQGGLGERPQASVPAARVAPMQPFVPRTAPPPINLPGAPKPEQMLEDHEEPHIEVPRPSAPTAAPAPMPRPAAPFVPSAPPVPPVTPQAPVMPTPPMPAPRAIIKEYASDPYHEPIE